LASLESGIREWLLKNGAGQAKRLTEKFGPNTISLLYRWCAAGIVIFEVEPPSHRDAAHGPLIRWRLTQPVRADAEETARVAEAGRRELAAEASVLTGELLAKYPQARLLGSVLTDCRDPAYVEHAVTVARTLVAGDSVPTDHDSNSRPTAEICF